MKFVGLQSNVYSSKTYKINPIVIHKSILIYKYLLSEHQIYKI
jgi:hypothetical protein